MSCNKPEAADSGKIVEDVFYVYARKVVEESLFAGRKSLLCIYILILLTTNIDKYYATVTTCKESFGKKSYQEYCL